MTITTSTTVEQLNAEREALRTVLAQPGVAEMDGEIYQALCRLSTVCIRLSFYSPTYGATAFDLDTEAALASASADTIYKAGLMGQTARWPLPSLNGEGASWEALTAPRKTWGWGKNA